MKQYIAEIRNLTMGRAMKWFLPASRSLDLRSSSAAPTAHPCADAANATSLSLLLKTSGQSNLRNGYIPSRVLSIVFLSFFSFSVSAAEVGKQAPDFTLKTNSGKNLKLSEQVGNVLLVNFWASWCGPCRQEMPLLETLQQKYEDLGFSIIAINVDENSELADKFLSSIEVTYPILYDNTAQVSQQFNVAAMPTTFILDRDGKVRFVHKGFKPGYEKKYEKEVKQLVRE